MEASCSASAAASPAMAGPTCLGELLAELDAPLVEAVDAPDDALGEGDVLVERDQLAEHRRGQRRGHDRRRRPVAGEHTRRYDGLRGALGPDLVGGLAEGERRVWARKFARNSSCTSILARRGVLQRVGGVGEGDEVGRDEPGALVDQLVERVLAVGAGLAPEDLAGGGRHRGAVPAHALAVGLHRQLLEVRREAVQQLGVGEHRVALGAEEVGVPDVEQPHQQRDVAGRLGGPEVLVHGVEAGQELGEPFRSDRHDQRRADRGVERVASADPVPEPEGVVGVDPEVRHLVERGRDRDEVLGDGSGVVASASSAPDDRSPSSSQALHSRALVSVSSVPKVLLETMKSVDSGSRPANVIAASVGSMLLMKRHSSPSWR